MRRQRRHSIFGRLVKAALPILKQLGKSALSTVGSKVSSVGTGLLTNLLSGKNLKNSLLDRTESAAAEIVNLALSYLSFTSIQTTVDLPRWHTYRQEEEKEEEAQQYHSLLICNTHRQDESHPSGRKPLFPRRTRPTCSPPLPERHREESVSHQDA